VIVACDTRILRFPAANKSNPICCRNRWRTVSYALRAHLASLREHGLRDSTTSRAEMHLRRFSELDENVDGQVVAYAKTGGFLEDLRLKHCEARYNNPLAVKTFGK
jgi:hypothetical protein